MFNIELFSDVEKLESYEHNKCRMKEIFLFLFVDFMIYVMALSVRTSDHIMFNDAIISE
jgi:hypothetical protein